MKLPNFQNLPLRRPTGRRMFSPPMVHVDFTEIEKRVMTRLDAEVLAMVEIIDNPDIIQDL